MYMFSAVFELCCFNLCLDVVVDVVIPPRECSAYHVRFVFPKDVLQLVIF